MHIAEGLRRSYNDSGFVSDINKYLLIVVI